MLGVLGAIRIRRAAISTASLRNIGTSRIARRGAIHCPRCLTRRAGSGCRRARNRLVRRLRRIGPRHRRRGRRRALWRAPITSTSTPKIALSRNRRSTRVHGLARAAPEPRNTIGIRVRALRVRNRRNALTTTNCVVPIAGGPRARLRTSTSGIDRHVFPPVTSTQASQRFAGISRSNARRMRRILHIGTGTNTRRTAKRAISGTLRRSVSNQRKLLRGRSSRVIRIGPPVTTTARLSQIANIVKASTSRRIGRTYRSDDHGGETIRTSGARTIEGGHAHALQLPAVHSRHGRARCASKHNEHQKRDQAVKMSHIAPKIAIITNSPICLPSAKRST